MAIAPMTKVMIACHRSQAAELLESLQETGAMEVLNAERTIAGRQWPDLKAEGRKPRDIEELVARLQKAVEFLVKHETKKGGMFRPLTEVAPARYAEAVSGGRAMELLLAVEQVQTEIEKLRTRREGLMAMLEDLHPWKDLGIAVEELDLLRTTQCFVGLLGQQHYDGLKARLEETGSAIEIVGMANNSHACVVVCPNAVSADVQRMLRGVDFETVGFEGRKGTVPDLIRQDEDELRAVDAAIEKAGETIASLAEQGLALKILYDYSVSLLSREQAKAAAPATEQVLLLEGWVKTRNMDAVAAVVRRFDAAGIDTMTPAPGEEIPVDVENKPVVQPFEFITRLYGMPMPNSVDPTIFLAPFFAVFFGICLGDAGYGLVTIVAAIYVTSKMQGDKKLVGLLGISSVFAVIFGALTGSWFGDAITKFSFLRWLDPLRVKIMWFDPFIDPMRLLALSLILGYAHLIFGLVIAMVHNLRQKNFMAAVFDQLTWLVMLNGILVYGLGKAGVVPPMLGKVCGMILPLPALGILVMSCREGGWGARLGMGAYNLFSAIFYLGDVLSYLRLMGLCMVGAGLAMAMNLLAEMALHIPFVGILLAIVIFIVGHGFNLVLAILGAFVHTMRLQFIEFFPKFLAGGGRNFEPLRRSHKYVWVRAAANK